MDTLEQLRGAVANPAELRTAIDGADIVPLLMTLVQLTGNDRWLDEVRPHIRGAWNFLQSIPEPLQAAIRDDLVAVMTRAAAEGASLPTEPPPELLAAMMETAVGQPVPDLYKPVFREEMSFGGIDHRTVAWRKTPDRDRLKQFKVVIVGAGFSGIAMAIKLQEAGIPYVIIEKNLDVGGTWLENDYPGCGVDTPCHFYSYSFKTNTEWSSFFAKRDEIQDYILKCVDDAGIRKNIRFGEEVLSADYDEARACWLLQTRDCDGRTHDLVANIFVSAAGALNRPSVPNIPGLSEFGGACFHTANWDKSVDLAGKRVAMIGTGASGMQVAPTIAPEVDSLTIFQRSPHWIIRHPLYHSEVSPSVRWAMKHIPYYASWFRFQLFWAASDGFHATLRMDPDWAYPERSLNAENDRLRTELIEYMTAELGDRADLLPKVTPDYPPFGKRMLRDNNWFKMLKRSNVELVTGGVERVERDAVIVDGQRHAVDVIVLATGFQAARMLWPMRIVGRDGVSIRDLWGDDEPRAHLGITVPGFPNFFVIYGPNTNLAHGGSAIFHSECQVAYIMQAIRELIETGADALEVREAPFEAYNQRVDVAHRGMVWSHPGVTNWYKNKSGRVVMNSPWRLVDYRNLTAEFASDEYVFSKRSTKADQALSERGAAA